MDDRLRIQMRRRVGWPTSKQYVRKLAYFWGCPVGLQISSFHYCISYQLGGGTPMRNFTKYEIRAVIYAEYGGAQLVCKSALFITVFPTNWAVVHQCAISPNMKFVRSYMRNTVVPSWSVNQHFSLLYFLPTGR
jgi:hypothetical protein